MPSQTTPTDSLATAASPPEPLATPYRPRLAIPLGDPAGIGPEVVLKAIAVRDWHTQADLTLVGAPSVVEWTYALLEACQEDGQHRVDLPDPATLKILVGDSGDLDPYKIRIGQEDAVSGAASFDFLQTAIDHTLAGDFEGIVTAPIAKSAWKAAGHVYPGQTELLAARAGVDRFGMAFFAQSPHTGWSLRTLLATTHIPLRQVPDALTPDLMSRKLELLIEGLRQDFGLAHPRVAIAGLNPHSGEQGQLGREEQDWLIPWLESQRQRYPQVHLDGPIPPDTLWVLPGQAWYGQDPTAPDRAHDAYLALYHDQGLIPVKLMAFDRAVNTTLGLPFVRTSPDHGTAFDIAGKGIAHATSMIAAIDLAVALACRRAGMLARL